MQRFGINFKTRKPYHGVIEVTLEDGTIGGSQCNFEAGDEFDYRYGQELALRRALGDKFGKDIANAQRELDKLWARRIEMENALAKGYEKHT